MNGGHHLPDGGLVGLAEDIGEQCGPAALAEGGGGEEDAEGGVEAFLINQAAEGFGVSGDGGFEIGAVRGGELAGKVGLNL